MSKLIMVIDDSASFRTVVRLALLKAGYLVKEAGDGQAALEMIDEVKPHLIVCDVNMPRMDGLNFARHLKAHPVYKYTPIVMLTTESSESVKEEGRAAGVKVWLTKPFQPSQLVESIRRLCS